MNKLDKAVEYAEELLEATRTRPERLLDSASSTSKWKTIYQRLLDLYLEENKKEPKCLKLRCTSHLLDKLVQREHLNTLVVNLYPGDEGYSLMLRGRSGADSETLRLPYEETELLEYVDAEQLPPLLVDLLDRVQANIFYCGCVIAEVRDYRRSVNNTYDTRHVLLKPTAQTLMCDVNAMTSGSQHWSQEDKLALESQLLLHVNEPLCLDPSPSVFFISNSLNYHKHKFNHPALKRAVKKYSQNSLNKKRKLAQSAAPKYLRLHDFLAKKKEKTKSSPAVNLKVGKTCVDMWRQREVHLTTPETIDVEKYAKALDKPQITHDSTPMVVEEYTFEDERSHGKVYFSRLTIMQRLNEEFYLGQLYVDRDYVEGKSKGSTCKFPLGTKSNVEKYIRQFREIFTEEGRRQVKITHKVPGGRPTVTYTQTLHTLPISQPTTSSQQTNIITQATNLAATITGQLGLAASGTDSSGKKTAPIRLSLSLNPHVSVNNPTNSQTGTPVTAQLTLNLPQQQLTAAQRLRQINIFQGLQRSASIPGGSATTPTSVAVAQTPTTNIIVTPQMSPSVKGGRTPSATPTATPTPTPTPTPPPNQQTPASLQNSMAAGPGMRRLSSVEGMGSLSGHPLHLNISGSIVQALSNRHPSSSSAPQTPTTGSAGDVVGPGSSVTTSAGHQFSMLDASTTQQISTNPLISHSTGTTPPPNVNIANLTTAPPNINIQNIAGLQGVNLAANLQGLHNVQVSLGSMNLPGSIAIPVPITHGSILVGSLPGMQASSNSGTASSASVGSISSISGTTNAGTPTLVTMVSTVPGVAPTAVGPTNVSAGTVLSSTSTGMLSLPIGVANNITQFMAGIKGSGIRPGTPLLLSQIPGQAGQQVQLLSAASLSQTRPQGVTLTAHSNINKQSTATTAVLNPQSLVTGQTSLAAIPQIRTASGQPQMLTAQQLVQLTSQQGLTQLALQQQQQQKIQAQPVPQKVTLQQLQQQQRLSHPHIMQQKLTHQQLQQLQQLQRQQNMGNMSANKSKSKKKSPKS